MQSWTPMQKAALCSLMESMRNFEEQTIPQDPQHCYYRC
jgi:hypothetical protein